MKKTFLSFLYCIFALLCIEKSSAQEQYRIVSYNVENLFDCQNDSLTNDDEFTPQGKRAWNYDKYQKKLGRISKVIAAINEGTPPLLIGLCEIENARVLTDLTQYSPLKAMNYRFVHFDSPDRRGIDTGLLYQRTLFRPFHSAFPRLPAIHHSRHFVRCRCILRDGHAARFCLPLPVTFGWRAPVGKQTLRCRCHFKSKNRQHH